MTGELDKVNKDNPSMLVRGEMQQLVNALKLLDERGCQRHYVCATAYV